MDVYAREQYPKFGEPDDAQLAQYVDEIGNWVQPNGQWDFETERYLGEKGPEIEKNTLGDPMAKECSRLITDWSIGFPNKNKFSPSSTTSFAGKSSPIMSKR